VENGPDDAPGDTGGGRRDLEDRRKGAAGRRRTDVERDDRSTTDTDESLHERLDKLEEQLASSASNADGQVMALYAGIRSLVAEVIRRRRKAEETCEILTQVLEATSDAFVALDADWRYTYVNAHAGRMFSRDPASLIGKHIWTEFPEGIGQPFHLAYERAVREGTPQQIEAYYPPYDRWFENRIFPYAGGVAIFFQDVTERRVADERLRESEQRYRSLFEHHPDAVYSFDIDGRFLTANSACEALTGYSPDELIGKSFEPLIVPEHRDRAVEHFRLALAGSAQSYEEAIVHKSGRRVEISITKLPIMVGGEVVGIFGIAKDLSPQRELESRLQQAEKMQAIGRLAGGIAHDFNNLLTIIQSCATFLARGLPPSSEHQGDVEEIHNASRRAGELTQQLLAFSRKQVMRPRRIDVNEQVVTFVGMLRRVIGEDVEIETHLAPGTWPVFADPGQLERVLMNLGLNARDAMPTGGTLRIHTENVVLDAGKARVTGGLEPGPYVSLIVEDTGVGIDPVVLPHIFEPFVTTKPHGVGTGLGLATAYGIVEQTGGAIDVTSKPGQGSRFTVFLPRAVATTAAHGVASAEALPRGTETIIVVEDERAVRSVIRRTLERQGYTVHEAASADDALQALGEPNANIALVLTDVVLVGESGRALAEQVTTRWPRLRVLFMSGYPDDEILRRGLIDPGSAFLTKPVTPEALARAVRQALDTKGTES
jgi:two-component system cell cycle sensor histidine kinase/response regulator CckA